jgi:DNA-binding transcriptional LysR family regulator
MTDSSSDRFVRSHLKTRHLVLLVELGRHGSIAHAAQAANLTQPGASKLLGELEHALGVQLFERLSRGVAPTSYGKVLIRRAGAALAEMDAAHQEVMELLSGLRGRVGLGTVLAPAAGLVPMAINLLKARHARVHVAVSLSTSKALVERLRGGELDLVLGRILDTEAADELHFEPLTDEPHLLIARNGHPLLGRADLRLEELMAQCWILPPAGSVLRDRLTALFLSHGLEQPAETVETLDMPVVASLLMSNDMIVALPRDAVRSYLDAGQLAVLPFDLGVSMDSFGIVTRKRHQLSPGADAMLLALRDAAAGLYPHYRPPASGN